MSQNRPPQSQLINVQQQITRLSNTLGNIKSLKELNKAIVQLRKCPFITPAQRRNIFVEAALVATDGKVREAVLEEQVCIEDVMARPTCHKAAWQLGYWRVKVAQLGYDTSDAIVKAGQSLPSGMGIKLGASQQEAFRQGAFVSANSLTNSIDTDQFQNEEMDPKKFKLKILSSNLGASNLAHAQLGHAYWRTVHANRVLKAPAETKAEELEELRSRVGGAVQRFAGLVEKMKKDVTASRSPEANNFCAELKTTCEMLAP